MFPKRQISRRIKEKYKLNNLLIGAARDDRVKPNSQNNYRVAAILVKNESECLIKHFDWLQWILTKVAEEVVL